MKEKVEKEQKKSRRKKLTRQEKKDTWTLIAVVAAIMLVSIVISLYKSGITDTGEYHGMTNREKREAATDARDIMIGAGAVCLVIIVVYVVKRARRRKKNDKNFDKFSSEQERIEAARRRVEKARLDRIKNEADSISNTKRSRQERLGAEATEIYGRSVISASEDTERMDEDERQAYLERRRREYRYYMENEDEDMSDELIEEMMNETEFVNKKWRNIAIICGIIVVVAIIVVIIILNI